LAKRIHGEFGSHQGSKHTIPNLKKDIETLMDSLNEHNVYHIREGRVLDPEDSPVPDVLSIGLAALSHGSSTNPLTEFNSQFDRLRERRRLLPITALLDSLTLDNQPSTSDLATGSTLSVPETEAQPMAVDLTDDEPPELVPSSDDEDETPEYDEDLFVESPTLTRLEEEDVALDMDDWMLDDTYDGLDDTDSVDGDYE
jgi:hypothetical protein